MTTRGFPTLDDPALPATRDAVHAYARVLGGWLTAGRAPRKHWWQGSLALSLHGLTTGVLRGEIDFELELDLVRGQLCARTADGTEIAEPILGQPAVELASQITGFLRAQGVDEMNIPSGDARTDGRSHTAGYSAGCGRAMAEAWSTVAAALEELRAGIREETSAIQLWPHHFDLSMVWLPGDKVPGQDPDSIEQADHADKQMSFGFTLGDEAIAEPYFYITAYPSPDAFATLALPDGAAWHTDGFTGVALTYQRLLAADDPRGYLLDLWTGLVSAGRDFLSA